MDSSIPKVLYTTGLLYLLLSVSVVNANVHCYPDGPNAKACKAKKCKWGYEESCKEKQWFQKPICTDAKDYRQYKSLDDKVKTFWEETDFGYVKKMAPSKYLCKPSKEEDSHLFCNNGVTYCHGKNIYLDLRSDKFTFEGRNEKIGFSGEKLFGGRCTAQNSNLLRESFHDTGLISWSRQLESFSELDFQPLTRRHCDVIVDEPTFIMELDAIGNLYHHFCDFFNLYITKHIYGSFSKDVNILLWQKYSGRFLGPFGDTWKLFTNRSVAAPRDLYDGKRVCFKDVIFSLLPRMALGMYYSTPLVAGCSHSGLFRAFSKYITAGFKLKQERKSKVSNVRVTLLSRGTQFRKILNKDKLMEIMREEPGVTVREVTFNSDMPFKDQLQVSHNTDLFIGIHGAGLTHALFMPDWGVLFELYNTDDYRCYRDLARLRGISYLTWEKNEKIEAFEEKGHKYQEHTKFKNFIFDKDEFKRMFQSALQIARRNLSSYFAS